MSILSRIQVAWKALFNQSTALVLTRQQLTGTWHQLKEEPSGPVLKYVHTCIQCSTEHQHPLTESAHKEIRKCKSCGRQYSLMHQTISVDADGKCDPAEYALRLAHLPNKLVKRVAPQRTMQAVGDEPVKVVWSGKPDGALQRAYDSGDPGNIPGNMF